MKKKFEYREDILPNIKQRHVGRRLNEMGSMGYELVAVVQVHAFANTRAFYFKREKKK